MQLGESDRTLVLSVSAATIDRLLGDVKVAASGAHQVAADLMALGEKWKVSPAKYSCALRNPWEK
jgi:hypothetical protein